MLRTVALAVVVCAWPCAASSLKVRLTTPLTSYDSATGSEVSAAVIAPYELDGAIVMPAGSTVHGTVRRTRAVGLGVVRERASMDLEFRYYELPDGRRFPFRASLRSIDNARETVNEEGRITGILAANGPQNLVAGVWSRPSVVLLSRSFIGLTGAGGRIFSEYSMGPLGGVVLFAIRCTLFQLPEPELRFPAGTEMKLTVTELALDAPTFSAPDASPIPADLAARLADQPTIITRPGGIAASDIINVAIAGSREDLVQAFEAAGWVEADVFSAKTVRRGYRAFTTQSGYARAPMSKLLYNGAGPDALFQKSFNNLSKRDHIRLWKTVIAGREIWLGAATHDIGVRLNTAVSFTHRIHPSIDIERSKVVDDLSFAGCVEPAAYLNRPQEVRSDSGDGDVVTDGRLAVLFSRPSCNGANATFSGRLPTPPSSRAGRMVRRMVLEGRQYALRGNPYYLVYRALALNRSKQARAEFNDE